MLEMPVKEVHLPDLHLPEAIANFEWPKVDMPSVDVGKTVNDVAVAAHLRRRSRPPRWPFALAGLLLAGIAGWVVLSNAAVRARLASGSRAIREQVQALASSASRRPGRDADDPVAFPPAETVPMQRSALDDAPRESTDHPTGDYPAGLGSNNGDFGHALAETRSPA